MSRLIPHIKEACQKTLPHVPDWLKSKEASGPEEAQSHHLSSFVVMVHASQSKN